MAVENNHVAVADDIKPTWTNQVGVTTRQQRAIRARVWAVDLWGCSIGDVVERSGEAIGRVEEEVDTLGGTVQRGGLDQRAIQHVAVEDLHRGPDRRDAVVRRDFLQHYRGRHDRCYRVAAAAAVAERVAVDFVQDVVLVVRWVLEAFRVDRPP